MTTKTTIQGKAQEASEWFETATRDNGSFVRVKDGAPEWVTELVYNAHGGDFLPDDWRYKTIRDALDYIAENGEEAEDAEFADDAVDVYTAARIAWLGSNLQRAGYCDQAYEELGGETIVGIIDRIGFGQYAEALEVFGLVRGRLEQLAEGDD